MFSLKNFKANTEKRSKDGQNMGSNFPFKVFEELVGGTEL